MHAAPNAPSRVYLAGPDVFFPEALKSATERKDFLAGLNMEGIFPLDAQDDPSAVTAASIFKANVRSSIPAKPSSPTLLPFVVLRPMWERFGKSGMPVDKARPSQPILRIGFP